MFGFVVPHDPHWKTAFDEEANSICASFPTDAITLHHIGSTAIPNILAKPIIDLLGIVVDHDIFDKYPKVLQNLGYSAKGEFGIDGRRFFQKVGSAGERTHHLHVFESGSPHIVRHLAFRDYLLAHTEIAAKYSAIKAKLTNSATFSRQEYIDGKNPFIVKTEKDAMAWSKSRN